MSSIAKGLFDKRTSSLSNLGFPLWTVVSGWVSIASYVALFSIAWEASTANSTVTSKVRFPIVTVTTPLVLSVALEVSGSVFHE